MIPEIKKTKLVGHKKMAASVSLPALEDNFYKTDMSMDTFKSIDDFEKLQMSASQKDEPIANIAESQEPTPIFPESQLNEINEMEEKKLSLDLKPLRKDLSVVTRKTAKFAE